MKTEVRDKNLEKRQGEADPIPQRNKRIFCLDLRWYFHTRESGDIGPYISFQQVSQALENFLHSSQPCHR